MEDYPDFSQYNQTEDSADKYFSERMKSEESKEIIDGMPAPLTNIPAADIPWYGTHPITEWTPEFPGIFVVYLRKAFKKDRPTENSMIKDPAVVAGIRNILEATYSKPFYFIEFRDGGLTDFCRHYVTIVIYAASGANLEAWNTHSPIGRRITK